jgi:hypothetical protein
MSRPGVLRGADDVLDAGVDAVGGVGVGALAAPAPRLRGEVRGPQRVAPPVGCLEQGQLRAGVGPLAAGEDPNALRPGFQLVAAGSLAQQCGQLGDVRFLGIPAGPARSSSGRPAAAPRPPASTGRSRQRGLLAGMAGNRGQHGGALHRRGAVREYLRGQPVHCRERRLLARRPDRPGLRVLGNLR